MSLTKLEYETCPTCKNRHTITLDISTAEEESNALESFHFCCDNELAFQCFTEVIEAEVISEKTISHEVVPMSLSDITTAIVNFDKKSLKHQLVLPQVTLENVSQFKDLAQQFREAVKNSKESVTEEEVIKTKDSAAFINSIAKQIDAKRKEIEKEFAAAAKDSVKELIETHDMLKATYDEAIALNESYEKKELAERTAKVKEKFESIAKEYKTLPTFKFLTWDVIIKKPEFQDLPNKGSFTKTGNFKKEITDRITKLFEDEKNTLEMIRDDQDSTALLNEYIQVRDYKQARLNIKAKKDAEAQAASMLINTAPQAEVFMQPVQEYVPGVIPAPTPVQPVYQQGPTFEPQVIYTPTPAPTPAPTPVTPKGSVSIGYRLNIDFTGITKEQFVAMVNHLDVAATQVGINPQSIKVVEVRNIFYDESPF